MKKIVFFILIFNLLLANNFNGITIYNSFEINTSKTHKPVKKENTFIFLNPLYHTSLLYDSFKTLKPKLNIAIVVDKKIFKKYL